MAALSNEDRAKVWAHWMRENPLGSGAMTKAQFRAAVDAMDAWIDSQDTAMNQAIPQPARSAMSTKQKAQLLTFVIQQRYLTS